MKRILIVEDDLALGEGIRLALRGQEMEISLCHTLAETRAALEGHSYSLLILDINLPDGSGLDLLREMRKTSATPIVLLTANDMETDVVTGLESGADDYITKPFSLAVLRARVNAQLRRIEPVRQTDAVSSPGTASPLKFGPFSFDFDRMEFRKGGIAVELSKTEQKLLRLLVENRGQTLPRSLLMDRVWTDGAEYVDENALSVTVKRLRNKLEDIPSKPLYLKTVYGIGYTWVAK